MIIFFIWIGLFTIAYLLYFYCFWIAKSGSSYNNEKSSHFVLVIYYWKTCLNYFLTWGSAFFWPVRNYSLVFCCCNLFPQSYIHYILSRCDLGMRPASTWILLSYSLCLSYCNFFALYFPRLLSYFCFCSSSQTFWMFFIDPGCHTFLFK